MRFENNRIVSRNKITVFIAAYFLILAVSMLTYTSNTEASDLLDILQEKGILSKGEAAGLKKGEAKKLKGKFKTGHKWKTGDKTGYISLGGRVHADINIFEDNHHKDPTFFLRRARIFAAGKFYENYKWKVQADFASGKVVAKDLWINIDYDPRFQFKIGQFMEPFAMEFQTSSRYIDFKERATISAGVGPERDIGAMLHGMFAHKTIGYQLGVFNGSGYNLKTDTDGDKDVAMRVWFEPFKDLHIGGAFTYGENSRGLHDYKAQGSSTKILDFNGNVNGTNMNLLRTGVEFVYGIGPFRVSSEYMRADYRDVKVVATGRKDDFYVQG